MNFVFSAYENATPLIEKAGELLAIPKLINCSPKIGVIAYTDFTEKVPPQGLHLHNLFRGGVCGLGADIGVVKCRPVPARAARVGEMQTEPLPYKNGAGFWDFGSALLSGTPYYHSPARVGTQCATAPQNDTAAYVQQTGTSNANIDILPYPLDIGSKMCYYAAMNDENKTLFREWNEPLCSCIHPCAPDCSPHSYLPENVEYEMLIDDLVIMRIELGKQIDGDWEWFENRATKILQDKGEEFKARMLLHLERDGYSEEDLARLIMDSESVIDTPQTIGEGNGTY